MSRGGEWPPLGQWEADRVDRAGLSFSFQPASIGRCNELVAAVDSDRVGGLEWDAWTGEVLYVWVVKARRREGIATCLWNEAQRLSGTVRPRHSPRRTPAGTAWVTALAETGMTGGPMSDGETSGAA